MLIQCEECKKEISDKATTCPHCGNPIQQKEVKEDTFKLNETGVFFFFAGYGVLSILSLLKIVDVLN